MLTEKQAKAIRILRDNPYITASRFAMLYFDTPEHEYLFTAVSNQGNGACAGKKAWLCAGSLLGKLKKELYVDSTKYDNPPRFYVTAVGRIMLNKCQPPTNEFVGLSRANAPMKQAQADQPQ